MPEDSCSIAGIICVREPVSVPASMHRSSSHGATQRGENVSVRGDTGVSGHVVSAECPARRNPNFVTKATGRLHLLCVSVCMFVCVSLQVCVSMCVHVCAHVSLCVHTHILEHYTCIHSLLLSL